MACYLITRFRGLTFLELLVALAIFLILITSQIIGWRHFMSDHHAQMGLNRLMNAIHLARSEAIIQGKLITLCGSRDFKNCDGYWQAGMIVMVVATHQVIRQYASLLPYYRLIWRSSLSNNISLNFAADGFTQGQQGAFYLCPIGEKLPVKRLVVNRSGRLREERSPVYAACS